MSWREKNGKKAVNLFIVGKLGQANLGSSASKYTTYHLESIFEQEMTMGQLLIDGGLDFSQRRKECPSLLGDG